jgi:putative ABC transport system substrate-binding protein
MRRRDFLGLMSGVAVAWPLSARAQQSAPPVVGFLDSGSPTAFAERVTAFRRGLNDAGFLEGRDVAIEYRWAEGYYDRLPSMAAELVAHRVSVIVATGSPNSAEAALGATKTIPIVFANGGDPVKLGLVSSLSRPGGNATGVSYFNSPLGSKRLELVRNLIPTATVIGFVVNPSNPNADSDTKDTEAAASVIGAKIAVLKASSESEIDAVFATLAQLRPNALLVNNDAFFSSRNKQFVALAASHATPTIYSQRDYVMAGGLASYGTNITEGYRGAGTYTGRILKGAKPAELPILLPTKFELVINLKTAKTLGLTIPPTLLALADEVIE